MTQRELGRETQRVGEREGENVYFLINYKTLFILSEILVMLRRYTFVIFPFTDCVFSCKPRTVEKLVVALLSGDISFIKSCNYN